MFVAAILVLFLFAIVILISSRFISKPGYAWFGAVSGGLIAWILILLSYPKDSVSIRVLNWSGGGLLFSSPTLLLDRFSWPFALAISTLLVSVLLTDVVRGEEIHPRSWSTSLGLTGFGLLSIFSGNPLTLALTWGILDLVEILTRFRKVTTNQQREHVVISLSARIFGSMLLILAVFRVSNLEINLEFPNIPPQATGLFVLAAGLRLGILPPQSPYLKEIPTRRGLGTQRRLIPVAASTILLTRVASVSTNPEWSLGLIITAAMALVYGSLAWLWAKNELDGRPFWIVGLSAFTIVACVGSHLLASQIWGLSLIFSGGLLFLYSYHDQKVLWLPILGMLGFIALPFTPAWFGLSIFIGKNFVFWLIFILGLVTLVFGYLRHMMRSSDLEQPLERWAWIVYPLGLAIMPITHFWVIWTLGGLAIPSQGVGSIYWWVGLLALVLVAPLYYVSRFDISFSQQARQVISEVASLGWLYKALWWIIRTLGIVYNYFLRMLEGDGGVLWAVLILLLVLAFFVNILGGT